MKRFWTVSLIALLLPLARAGASLGPNLINNPSFEASSTSPTGWHKGGYGTNSRALSFPVSGYDGANAARVSITSYTSGDAKWYFDYVPVAAGRTYQFSDYYKSDTQSIVDVQFKLSDGTFSYLDIALLPASSTYSKAQAQFVIPSNAVSLTIFHVIKSIGTLDTDAYSLNEVTADSAGLITNGDLEMGTNGAPTGWSEGRWGTNAASFVYPATGANGSRGAQISVTSYASGDAKWYFDPLKLDPGPYKFSDMYTSDVESYLTAQFHRSDGSYSYVDLKVLSPASSFTPVSAVLTVPPGVADVTIFHLIKSTGTLTIDNASLTKDTSSSIFSTGAVSLTFDDGHISQYQNAFPKLKSADLKGTFFIVTHEMADYGFPGYMSIAQVLDMYHSGEEIGAHTRTHPYLSELSSADQQTEIEGSKEDLLSYGVGSVTDFAYPFGDYDSTTLSLVKNDAFVSARTSNGGFALPSSDHFQLPREGIDSSTSFSQVQGWIDAAIQNKQWLILVIHRVDDSGSSYSVTPAIFNQIVDYLVSQRVKVVTVSEGMKDMPN